MLPSPWTAYAVWSPPGTPAGDTQRRCAGLRHGGGSAGRSSTARGSTTGPPRGIPSCRKGRSGGTEPSRAAKARSQPRLPQFLNSPALRKAPRLSPAPLPAPGASSRVRYQRLRGKQGLFCCSCRASSDAGQDGWGEYLDAERRDVRAGHKPREPEYSALPATWERHAEPAPPAPSL